MKKFINETIFRIMTPAQINLTVDLVNQGKTYREVQNLTGIPHNTVSNIIKKYNLIGTMLITT